MLLEMIDSKVLWVGLTVSTAVHCRKKHYRMQYQGRWRGGEFEREYERREQ